MDKLRAKKTEVTIETRGIICDAVDSNIKDGQEACKSRWSFTEVFLDFLELPLLDPIDEAPSPKLNLEEMEHNFVAAKEQIQELIQLTFQEISRWIDDT